MALECLPVDRASCFLPLPGIASAGDRGLPSPEALARGLLAEFQTVYNMRDVEAYSAMFDPWVFGYEFSPGERRPGTGDTWDYAAEVRVSRRMFVDPHTTVVDLHLVLKSVAGASSSDALPSGLEMAGTWKATAAASLDVLRDAGEGESRYYGFRDHLHEFYFRRGSEDEGRAWRIVYWRDATRRDLVNEPDSSSESRSGRLTWKQLKVRYQ
jgi:hypothetical protein